MKDENDVQRVIGEKTISWAGVFVLVLLVLLVLGGLLFNFFVPIPQVH